MFKKKKKISLWDLHNALLTTATSILLLYAITITSFQMYVLFIKDDYKGPKTTITLPAGATENPECVEALWEGKGIKEKCNAKEEHIKST